MVTGWLAPLLAPWLSPAQRSYWLGGTSGEQALATFLGTSGANTAAGVPVSEYTALNLSAVWCAVTMIASSVAALPLFFYKRLGEGGKEQFARHPLWWLLHDEPNPEMGSYVFRETLTEHCLLWGNGYAEIQRDVSGRPVALWPITPDRVRPERSQSGTLRYRVTNTSGSAATIVPENMLHVRGMGWDGVVGYSVIRKARESLGLTAASEKFGSEHFAHGARASLVATHPGQMNKEQQGRLRESIEQSMRTGVMVLEEGITVAKTSIPPDDSQFLETRQFQTEEIAR